MFGVADWSQAKIGYTNPLANLVTGMLRIGLRPRLVTLLRVLRRGRAELRIGLRPRLVTLKVTATQQDEQLRIGLRPRLVTLVVKLECVLK